MQVDLANDRSLIDVGESCPKATTLKAVLVSIRRSALALTLRRSASFCSRDVSLQASRVTSSSPYSLSVLILGCLASDETLAGPDNEQGRGRHRGHRAELEYGI